MADPPSSLWGILCLPDRLAKKEAGTGEAVAVAGGAPVLAKAVPATGQERESLSPSSSLLLSRN